MRLGSTRAQKRAFGLVLRSPFAIFAQDAGIGYVLLRLVINITKYKLYEYRVRKVQYLEGGERG